VKTRELRRGGEFSGIILAIVLCAVGASQRAERRRVPKTSGLRKSLGLDG
jgi:hypothetical protein